MKSTARIIETLRSILLASLLAVAPLAAHASTSESIAKIQPLRGTDVQAPDAEPDMFRQERDRGAIERNYAKQPPLIPHVVENYKITKNFNKCLDCHSWSRNQETGATKVSITHFKDRNGTELANISARRYFCVQCHIPQTDAKPLVANIYKPANAVK